MSAGLLRVFGPDIAELPLVATTKGNQGKVSLSLFVRKPNTEMHSIILILDSCKIEPHPVNGFYSVLELYFISMLQYHSHFSFCGTNMPGVCFREFPTTFFLLTFIS